MLQALDDLLHSAEFEDDGWLTIRLARWREGDLLLEVEVQPGAAAPQQDWEIACRGVRRFQVRGEPAYGIDVHDEHVLLWPHRPVQEELFISSAPASASALAGDLWASHRELTADWIPAESFLNPDSTLAQLLAAGNGLLARGPARVLAAYEAVLRSHGVRCNRLGARAPFWWRDGQLVPESGSVRALVIGSSFVIAESFGISRIS